MLNVPDIKLRTSDPRFLQHVERWYGVLLPRLVPYLYRNGGPVVMAQVENEYGSFHACDRNYTIFLRDVIRSHLGNETVLFTVDGGAVSYLKCGVVPDVFATVDFGTDSRAGVAGHFQAQRQYQPKGPLVNTEFYPGWLDVWGDTWSVVNTDDVVLTMAYMYQLNASFNFYMFHGKLINFSH